MVHVGPSNRRIIKLHVIITEFIIRAQPDPNVKWPSGQPMSRSEPGHGPKMLGRGRVMLMLIYAAAAVAGMRLTTTHHRVEVRMDLYRTGALLGSHGSVLRQCVMPVCDASSWIASHPRNRASPDFKYGRLELSLVSVPQCFPALICSGPVAAAWRFWYRERDALRRKPTTNPLDLAIVDGSMLAQ